MRVFLTACVLIVVLGVVGYYGLNTMQKPSGIAYATDGARIDPQWSWRAVVDNAGAATPGGPSDGCEVRTPWQWIFVDLGIPDREPKACFASQ